MKLYNISKNIILMLSMSALVVACDDSNDYEGPGKPVSPDCMKVYFSSENATEFVFSPEELGDDYSLNLTVNRVGTEEAADVPVIVEFSDECFSVPETVHFEAGEESAPLKISFPEIPLREAQNFMIKIADKYADPYSKELDGIARYSGKVLVSVWKKIVKNVEIEAWDKSWNYMFDCTSDIYWLEGQNQFRFSNFLESGVDLTFELSNPSFNPDDVSTWTGNVLPLDHYQTRVSTQPSWYLLNDAGERFSWTISSTGYTIKTNVYFRTDGSYFQILDMNGDPIGYDYQAYVWLANTNQTWAYMYWTELNLDGYDD